MAPIYFLLLFPLLIPLVLLWLTNRFTKEYLLHALGFIGGGMLVCWLLILSFNSYTPKDTEVINGFVTGKEINRFMCPVNTSNPCENDYACNCRMVSYSCTDSEGKSKTCWRQECDTCYKYAWEQNYFIDSSLQGERAYKVRRVDPQGVYSPPRWLQTHRGDPVSITREYENYILNVADSLFSEDGKAEEKYKAKIPTYPLNIYDLYRIDRLVTVGDVRLDKRMWNDQISRTLVYVGPEKQANIVVVVAEGVGMDFANAVRRAWKGFKKNDIVVFVGIDKAQNVQWTRVMSWSKASIVNIAIETDIIDKFQYKQLEVMPFMASVKLNALKHFERRSMSEFEYLKDQTVLSSTQVTWLLILLCVVQVGLALGQLYLSGGIPFTNIVYETSRQQYQRIYENEAYLAAQRRMHQAPYGTRRIVNVITKTTARSVKGTGSRFKP